MIEGVEALRELSGRYARGVDRRDVDTFLAAFHPDATLTVVRDDRPGTPMTGHDELAKVIERIARYDATHHLLGQSTYRGAADGEHATGEVYCTASHLKRGDDGHPTNTVMYIRYLDTYERRDSAWRISARQVVVEWSERHDIAPVDKGAQ